MASQIYSAFYGQSFPPSPFTCFLLTQTAGWPLKQVKKWRFNSLYVFGFHCLIRPNPVALATTPSEDTMWSSPASAIINSFPSPLSFSWFLTGWTEQGNDQKATCSPEQLMQINPRPLWCYWHINQQIDAAFIPSELEMCPN